MDVVIKCFENVKYSVGEMRTKARAWHENLETISGYETLLVADMGGGQYISITIFDDSCQPTGSFFGNSRSKYTTSPFDQFRWFEAEGSLIYQRGL